MNKFTKVLGKDVAGFDGISFYIKAFISQAVVSIILVWVYSNWILENSSYKENFGLVLGGFVGSAIFALFNTYKKKLAFIESKNLRWQD